MPEWADRNRFLATESGSSRGRFQTSKVEIARGPMLAITEPGVEVISLMVSTQLFKTTVIENAFGYFAHLDPSPILLLQPKDKAAKDFSKERIAPMIRRTPALRALMGSTARARGADEDTLQYKPFPGGFLALEGAGSPDNLARRPIRILLADEIDKYQASREGDPVTLAEERQATFDSNALSIRACSPTVGEESPIEDSYNESDRRRPSVACPHCGHRLFLDFFRHVDWDKRRRPDGVVASHLPETAGIVCEACGVKWSEGARLESLASIRWHQTRPFECCDVRQVPLDVYEVAWRAQAADPVSVAWDWWEDGATGRYAVYRARCSICRRLAVPNTHAGFHCGKLFSPWSMKDSPAKIAGKWLRAQGNHERLQAWWNTQAGLPYRATTGKTLDVDELLRRREVWAGQVPPGAGVLTVAMDTQDTWVELETVAWGLDQESWSIDHTVIQGAFSSKDVQRQVDEYLLRTWLDAKGRPYRIAAACLDSGGHHVQDVYGFCRDRSSRRIWAIKGASERDGARNPVWPRKPPSRRSKASFRPVIIGGNTARDTVRSRITLDPPTPGVPCPGYIHHPTDRDVGYMQQLMADRRELRETKGRKFTVWVTPTGRANEAADLKVYNLAALEGLIFQGLRLNAYVTEILEAPSAAQLEQAPVVADPVVGRVNSGPIAPPPPERKMSIVQVEVPAGKSIASRLA